MQVHGISASKHPMPVNTRTHCPQHGSVGEAGASSPILFFRRARKTHRELHEEVFTPIKVSVEQPSSKPPGEIKARRPTISSRMTNARPALPQAASAVPPVPPLPISKRPSSRMPSHNAEARLSGSSTLSQPTEHHTSSHGMKNTHPLSTHSDESIAHSNSLTSLNSNSRRDYGHSKQGLRPRDSLVLEKARHFDHLHTLRKVFTLW